MSLAVFDVKILAKHYHSPSLMPPSLFMNGAAEAMPVMATSATMNFIFANVCFGDGNRDRVGEEKQ